MSYDKVASAKGVIVGTKQTAKALKEGNVGIVIIADDADRHVTHKVFMLANELDVPVETVDSMKRLGQACGIEVGAATVAIIKG